MDHTSLTISVFEPTLGQLAPAVSWLRARGVEISRLAAAFQTTRGHIRVLAYRGRADSDDPRGTHLGSPLVTAPAGFSPDPKGWPSEDSVILTGSQLARLDALEERIVTIRTRAEAEWELLDGAHRLRALQPVFGRPASARIIRVRSSAHRHTAWCLVHAGLTRSAARSAMRAIEDAGYVHRETQDVHDLQLIADAALIASHSWLLRRRPAHAERYLRLVRETAEAMGLRITADYYRQSGLAAFQRGNDREARILFQRAAEEVPRLEPQQSVLAARFMSLRHTVSMDPVDWDSAQALLSEVRAHYGALALEGSMMAHWMAVTGFSTDSPSAHDESRQVLAENQGVVGRFGHQATLSRLLVLTPDLRLPLPLRRVWLRWVMYANAYGQR